MKRRTADVTVFFSLTVQAMVAPFWMVRVQTFTHPSTSNKICGLRAVPVPFEEKENSCVFLLLLFIFFFVLWYWCWWGGELTCTHLKLCPLCESTVDEQRKEGTNG